MCRLKLKIMNILSKKIICFKIVFRVFKSYKEKTISNFLLILYYFNKSNHNLTIGLFLYSNSKNSLIMRVKPLKLFYYYIKRVYKLIYPFEYTCTQIRIQLEIYLK
jgi:hypothetical protein